MNSHYILSLNYNMSRTAMKYRIRIRSVRAQIIQEFHDIHEK